ncbi:MAG: DUF5671 domain-containing protein [Candidatus Uhrbacteria bacterium]|nr:DUF5671 domain-containing protein [Candidatus Uhrbacteria bacterium]
MPKSTLKSTPKDVFSYLLAIITLYIGVISLLTIIFQTTNIMLPDPLDFYYSGALNLLRGAMAALIVGWPIFILISWTIGKDISANPQKIEIRVRKWLLYFTLFVASITIIIDLITLINSFLSGELSTRFIIKVVAVLLVTAAVFGYYLWSLRRDLSEKTNVPKLSAWISSALMILSITAGFYFVGSPGHQRNVRFDDQRLNDLQMIVNQAVYIWSEKDELPATLYDLSSPISGFVASVDPETGVPYTYTVLGDLEFEVCGTFATESVGIQGNIYVETMPRIGGSLAKFQDIDWEHGIGETCFTRTIDPDLYDIN